MCKMSGDKISQVVSNFENLKKFLIEKTDNLLLEKIKTRLKISRRRQDLISNVSLLLVTLEKHSELDPFNIYPIELMCGLMSTGTVKEELNNFIRLHKTLIDKCDNVVIPVRNQYAEEVLQIKSTNNLGRTIGSNSSNSNYKVLNSSRNVSLNSQFSFGNQENIQSFETGVSDVYSDVITLISDDIGLKWKDMARYLGLRESEIEEIMYDREIATLADKSRKALNIALGRKNPGNIKRDLLEALSRSRRNDLRLEIESMI